MRQPLVAVSTDVKQFDNYTWHATPQQYLEAALTGAGVLPVMVPSFGERLDIDSLLASVDGVMVTGSRSNVHPSHYGGDASEANGPYDEARDATTLPLIRSAIERGVPLLAICRGIQELNVALGGTLATSHTGAPRFDRRSASTSAWRCIPSTAGKATTSTSNTCGRTSAARRVSNAGSSRARAIVTGFTSGSSGRGLVVTSIDRAVTSRRPAAAAATGRVAAASAAGLSRNACIPTNSTRRPSRSAPAASEAGA